jgi:molecular chaperone DnaK
MASYWLGIDLGTAYTAAAICWPTPDGLLVQAVPLSNHSHTMPSVLFLPGDGSLVIGEDAQRESLADPGRTVREFKSRVGDEHPLLVSGSPYYAHDLAAEFVSWLCQYVTQREGERPEAVALTCPASWGPDTRALFERAVRDAGVPNVMALTEPQAAAISYASREQVEIGAVLAVYDLGAASFGATVLRQDSPTGFTVLGQPEYVAGLGGLSFDEVIFEYVCAAAGVPVEAIDPDDRDLAARLGQLRRECTEAKEALSAGTDVTIAVELGRAQHWVRLTRTEFEEMIRPDLDRTIEAMRRTLGSAGIGSMQLDAVVLAGGSARIPLIARLVSGEFGRPLAVDADPKISVAMGAARFPAPASAPVRSTAETAMALPPGAAPDQGRPVGRFTTVQRPSRKVMAGIAAVVVLVLAGGMTALASPVMSALFGPPSAPHGTTAGGGIPSASGASGSPAPSAQRSAKPAATVSAAATTGTNGSVVTASSSKAAAKASSKGATPAKTSKSAPATSPVVKRTRPVAPPPTTTTPAGPPTSATASAPPTSATASPPPTTTTPAAPGRGN